MTVYLKALRKYYNKNTDLILSFFSCFTSSVIPKTPNETNGNGTESHDSEADYGITRYGIFEHGTIQKKKILKGNVPHGIIF